MSELLLCPRQFLPEFTRDLQIAQLQFLWPTSNPGVTFHLHELAKSAYHFDSYPSGGVIRWLLPRGCCPVGLLYGSVRKVSDLMSDSRTPSTSRISRRAFSVMASGLAGWSLLPRCLAEGGEHPLRAALEHAGSCLKKTEALAGYETTFVKREVVGKTLVNHQIRMKVRHEPFSVYMYFENPYEGREVIYVEGRNNNNLLAHETGLAGLIGTVELSPTSPQAMAENRYPITRAGLANMVRAVMEQWEGETRFGETDVKYYKDARIGEFTCRVIESVHPQPRKQFRFHMTRLWIDDALGLPVRVQQFGFPAAANAKPPAIEDYVYSNIRPDVRLTDRDFDTRNPNYRF